VGLERAAWLERRYGARVEWYPFDLHPEYPPEGAPRTHRGGAAQRMIEEAGLVYSPPADRVSNSRGALQLAEFAREQGRHDEAHQALFRAYWSEGRDIGSRSVLEDVASAIGVDADEALAAVDENRFLERVLGSTSVAVESGVDGVPAWIVDRRLLVPGAQPREVFDRVMEQLGHEPLEAAS